MTAVAEMVQVSVALPAHLDRSTRDNPTCRVYDNVDKQQRGLKPGDSHTFKLFPLQKLNIHIYTGMSMAPPPITVVNQGKKRIHVSERTAAGDALDDVLDPRQSRKFSRPGSNLQLTL